MTHSAKGTNTKKAAVAKDPRQKWFLGIIRASGLSKAGIADRVGISYTNVVSITNGRRKMSDRDVYRVMAALSCEGPPGIDPISPSGRKLIGGQADMVRELQGAAWRSWKSSSTSFSSGSEKWRGRYEIGTDHSSKMRETRDWRGFP